MTCYCRELVIRVCGILGMHTFESLLISDDEKELHIMAARVGVPGKFLQDQYKLPVYSMTPRQRTHSLQLGAISLNEKEFAKKIPEIIKSKRKRQSD